MSLIENFRQSGPKPGAQIPKAPDIAAQLSQAESDYAALQAEHGSIALDAIAGLPGGSDRLQELQRDLATIGDRVATLKAAHKAAIERDEAAVKAQRAALQKTQLAAVRKHLEARDAAAVAFSRAIEEATKQFHTLLDRSAKAESACPIGMAWPHGSLCGRDPIRALVANEIFRLSASPGNGDGRALPGAEMPSPEYQWQPAALPALGEKIGAASKYVLAKLTGKAAE